MDYDAIVIGAGVGGLSAGATLASRGLRTLVLEQSNTIGGCCSSFDANGFTFDAGASIIELPRFHDWFYENVGLRREEYLTFIQNEPLYELIDMLAGERFTVPTALEGVAEIIGRHSARDARAFLRLMNRQGRMLDDFCDVLLTTPQGRLRDMARVFARYPRLLLNMRCLLTPYKKYMEDHFEHEFTRRLLTNYSVIGGLPPSRQSAMMLWLCYAEHDGMYYPRGGMGAVPRGMARALEDLGGELKLNTSVVRLHLEKGKARGVVLEDGTTITSRGVVSNVNAGVLYREMVGDENLPGAVVKGLDSYDYSPSCTVGHIGLDYKPPLKAQHMMALASPELIEGFWSGIYDKGVAMPESVGLVSSPSFMDESLAPEGCHNLSFINLAPRHPRGASWDEMKWEYLEKGIGMLDTLYLPGIKDHVVFKTIATPEDFERRLGIPNGSMYGFSMSMLSQMMFRPGNMSRCVRNLYLCGASTHAGSVPGAVCSGVLAAGIAASDLNGRWRK